MRTKRVERLLRLIQLLQSGRTYTVDDLAGAIGVSRRTVFRDLELLTRAGISYEYDREKAHYSTQHTALLPPVALTHREALSLLLATRSTIEQPFVVDKEAAGSAALKVEGMLPPLLRDYCGSLLEHLELHTPPASDTESIVTTMLLIQSALAQKQKLWMRYDSYAEGEVIEVTLDPYRLVFVHRGWYLMGYTAEERDVRTYKVERILDVKLLKEQFATDPNFNLDDYFGDAWLMIPKGKRGHVKIRFSKKVASNVDEIAWHRSQQTFYEDDGSLIFEVDVAGIEEISWWILGYGQEAEVLEPKELRDLIATHARSMLASYAVKSK